MLFANVFFSSNIYTDNKKLILGLPYFENEIILKKNEMLKDERIACYLPPEFVSNENNIINSKFDIW